MPLPPKLQQDGFVMPSQTRTKIKLPNGQFLKPLLIGSDGETDSGKTEFALSIPGNKQMVSVDRNYDGVFDNPKPPKTRDNNIAVKVIQPPLQGTALIPEYQKYHADIRDSVYRALVDPWSSVVFVDGDSDWWEIHILAHFGKTTQIYPQTRYAAPYAEKRAIIARMHDSGKIVICTNKVKDEYETVMKADGTPEKDQMGEDKRQKTGRKERQGFKDQDYLWNIQLHHMYKPAGTRKIGARTVEVEQQWGIRLVKVKHNMGLVGSELWGEDCCFRGLVDLVFPDVDPRRFGFDE